MRQLIYNLLLVISLVLINTFSIQAQGVYQLPTDRPLTVDAKLQNLAERLLNGKQGSIVAIDPSTGEILCMVSHNKVDASVNRAISMEYSPGSTFKVAQAATLLTFGAITPETQYPCHKGFWTNGIHIGCHEHHSPLDLVQAIGQSCNAWWCQAFRDFVDDRALYPVKATAINDWHSFMASMGLGHSLGIDLPGEVGGLIPDAAYLDFTHHGWNGTTIMWLGMGQGEVRITPLQLCNLAAVIANRGYWYTPHIHKNSSTQVVDSVLTVRHQSRPSKESFEIVIEGMRAAVINGTCTAIRNPHYKVCGKTGTAQNEGHDHSVFMGFAPEKHPRIAVSVYVENGGWGADLACPLGGLVMEQYIMGKLSPASEEKVKKWERKNVKIKAVEIPIMLDDL